jgi:sterol desaturase/sphingolipid hydroxylase (fatty acid hydroxylase superfamily)
VGWIFRANLERLARSANLGVGAVSLGLLAWIVLIWCAEQIYPANEAWNYRLLSSGALGWNRLRRDLFYLFYVTFGTTLLLDFTSARIRAAIERVGDHFVVWPRGAPLALRIGLAFLLVELLSYWFHRAAHRFRFLWQFHSTHHVVTELGGLKATRTHPIENLLFYLVRCAPLMLIGAGSEELVGAISLGSFLGILAHANLSLAEGPLGLVINFPRYHAVHHSSRWEESQSNFGCHTILWDRVFGTFRRCAIEPLEIGVQPLGRRSLWQELGWPFYRWVDRGS